jgi:hypothetical protein
MGGDPDERGQPGAGDTIERRLLRGVELDGQPGVAQLVGDLEQPVAARAEDGDAGPGRGADAGGAEFFQPGGQEGGFMAGAGLGIDLLAGGVGRFVGAAPFGDLSPARAEPRL